MTKDVKETKKTNRRTQIKDLPKSERELGVEEQKKVKGGFEGAEKALLNRPKPSM